MVEVPAPIIVITLLIIVATAVFELVYVNKPSLLVDGALILNGMFPNVFIIAEKLVRTVVIRFISSSYVVVPDV